MAQIDNNVEGIMGLSHRKTHDNPTPSKIIFDDLKKAILAKEWIFFHLLRKKVDYIHLKDFLKYEIKLFLKQSLTTPQCRTIVAYNTSNHTIAFETG
jgi:hypothetical protein